MKIKAGKYYTTRDGRKVGPMEEFKVDSWCGFVDPDSGLVFCKNGNHGDGDDPIRPVIQNVPNLDLVAEWKDENNTSGPTLSGDTIDYIAIDSLKWHYNEGKNDMEPLQKEAFEIVLRYYGVNL